MTLMQLPLALGIGDITGGRSTEQGKPLWKKHPSHQRSRATEQHEGCCVLSAPCSRFWTGFLWFPAKALPGSSVPELNAHNLLVGFYYKMDWCRQKSLDLLTQPKCCTEFLGKKSSSPQPVATKTSNANADVPDREVSVSKQCFD